MRCTSRGPLLVCCLLLAALWGCDDGGGDGADQSVDTGPETDASEPEPDLGDPEPDMGDPEPDMGDPDTGDPDMADPEPDMALPCEDGETRDCAVDGAEDCAGTQTCVDGAFGPCAPPVEICDGADTDCNGTIDDVEGAGEACTAGIGACAVDGVFACGPDGAVVCDAVVGEAGVELCASGADEDCDGETDEADCRDACAEDGDCDAGELCIAETCVPGDCREDGACAEGELCIDNGCRPGDCRVDGDCGEGEICADFGCRPVPAACRDPQAVAEAGVFEGSTVDAPSDVGASCGGGGGSPERAFRVDLGVEGPICLSTLGSDYDTVLFAQSACGDPASELACNDDARGGLLQSRIELPSGAEPVFVFVDGFFGAFDTPTTGDFTLTVSEGPCPCLTDEECGEDEVCRAGACAPVVCGDGAREGFEECDDGGIDPGDGCDAACFLEGGFVCAPGPDGVDRCRPEVCVGDDDCFDDEICVAGACVVGDCRDDGECGEGELCLDNTCTPGDCRENADCADGQICDSNACADAPAEGTVRLADGDDDHVGRVELFVQGAWGTVCDDRFDGVDAEVVCRQLGFPGAVRAIERFGGGDDPIWLDEVACAGGEARLFDCPADPLGENDCGHAEDVGVECLRPCAADDGCLDGELCFEGACRVPADEICDNGVDDDLDGSTDCDDEVCADAAVCLAPSACDAPIALEGPGLYAGDTTGAPAGSRETDPDCISSATPADSSEAVYAFTAEDDAAYCFSTLGSSFDTVLYVRADACEDPAGEVACNDDNGEIAGGTRSALTLNAEAGTRYFVFVDGFGFNNDGPYELRVTEGPCAVPVETCDNGINDDLDPQVDCDDPDCFGSAACLDLNCGNGVVDLGEACDDGARDPGDGCDDRCLVEPGFVCDEAGPDQPSECRIAAQCGDGNIDPPETCDDGNADGGDGCDALCTDEEYVALRGVEQFVVAFPADAEDRIRIDADAVSTRIVARTGDGRGGCIGDTVLDLYPIDVDGDRGERVATNDDGGDNGLCSLIDAVVDAGDYEVVVRGSNGLGLVDVVVDVRVAGILSNEVGGGYDGDLPVGGDDLFELTLDGPATVTLETGDGQGGCPGDTVMTLFELDAAGERAPIASSDDEGVDLCSFITLDLGPGRYEVEVAEFDRDPALQYVLGVDLLFPECGNDAVEAGEQCDDGNVLDRDGCDALCTFDRYDAVQGVERFEAAFGANADDGVRFTVDHRLSRLLARTGDGEGGCPGDTVLDVYTSGPDGERVEPVANADDGAGVGACSLIDVELPPGDHELVVRGFGGIPLRGVVVDYRLEVAIDAGGVYDGAVDVGGSDLYVFSVDAPTAVTLQTGDGAGGCPGDSRLYLYAFDQDGARFELDFSDDADGLDVCSRIEIELPPGDYEVEVDEFSRDAPLTYVLTVDGLGAPPEDVFEVSIVDFDMQPDPLVVPVGSTVRWTNLDAAVHTVTSGVPGAVLAGAIFDSGNLAQGETFEYTFQSVGEFNYFCRPHSGFMRDYTVIVDIPDDPALAACEESCADIERCFGVPPDPECVDGCMSTPDNQAAGRCIAEGLDPDAGRCNFAVIGACG